MSSMSITGQAFIAAPVRTRLRITERGRRVLTFAAALPLVAIIIAGVMSGGAAVANRTVNLESFDTVTVSSGDSLWTIAEEVAPAADPRDVIDAIVRLNALGDSALLPGQSLAIPAEYSSAE